MTGAEQDRRQDQATDLRGLRDGLGAALGRRLGGRRVLGCRPFRRIARRAMRHGYKLGQKRPFFYKLVAEVVKELGLSKERLERLKTAVAEATMNAMEHGSRYRPEVPVVIEVLSSGVDLSVRVNDQGKRLVPDPDREVPELESKLQGLQMPRGWGLFLIRNMVDEMHITSDEVHHTVELVMHLEGGEDAA
mgnify:CR=1 FL=1